MNNVGRSQVDQWYLRQDKGESFLVTAIDDKSRSAMQKGRVRPKKISRSIIRLPEINCAE